MRVSRRSFVAAGVGGCLCCAAASVAAKVLPTTLQPLVGENYSPVDVDERGMWQAVNRFEESLAESDLVLRAPDLQAYTAYVVERLIGRPATEFRIYIVRDPTFNASMTATGMMMVHTGFLARVHDEAQFSAVLGHEAGHYYRKHSIESWRDAKTKSAAMAFVAAGANTAAGYSAMQGYNGQSWIDLANSINQAIVLSFYRFSREQETEADAYGIGLMAKAGYTPKSASLVWRQLIEERRASARERDKRYKDNSLSAYSTHPPSGDRMEDLAETAAEVVRRGAAEGASPERDEWRKKIAPHFAALLDEQVKLNDSGASLYLIESHAREGWTGVLRYYEGEAYRLRGDDGDDVRAGQAYAAAVAFADAPPEAWRAHGYALMKSSSQESGRQALSRYLELRPDAKDAAMIRFSLQQ